MNCQFKECSPQQLNHICSDLANNRPGLPQYSRRSMFEPSFGYSILAFTGLGSVTDLELVSEIHTQYILFSPYSRWPAIPTHPCTELTQCSLHFQTVDCRHNSIMAKCMFWPPKPARKHRLEELISILRQVQRERII